MKSSHLLLLVSLCLSLLLLIAPLRAEEKQGKPKGYAFMSNNTNQQVLGAGNTEAIRLAEKSPLVQSAKIFLVNQTEKIKDIKLRKATLDAIDNPTTCIMHRYGLSEYIKKFRNPVLSYLSAERLLIIYGNRGLDGVIAEIRKLNQK
jgi:hypothetical protein